MFLKSFTGYIKNIEHQNSQRANSVFTIDVFAIIYSNFSILEINEAFYVSPTQTCRHAIIKREITFFTIPRLHS